MDVLSSTLSALSRLGCTLLVLPSSTFLVARSTLRTVATGTHRRYPSPATSRPAVGVVNINSERELMATLLSPRPWPHCQYLLPHPHLVHRESIGPADLFLPTYRCCSPGAWTSPLEGMNASWLRLFSAGGGELSRAQRLWRENNLLAMYSVLWVNVKVFSGCCYTHQRASYPTNGFVSWSREVCACSDVRRWDGSVRVSNSVSGRPSLWNKVIGHRMYFGKSLWIYFSIKRSSLAKACQRSVRTEIIPHVLSDIASYHQGCI